MDNRTEQYLNSLTEKELKAYKIAKSHLGSSFDLKKSNGFLEWEKTTYKSTQDSSGSTVGGEEGNFGS